MNKIKKLLLENKAWAQGKTIRDPQYFSNMAKDQKPEYLWIGCSDSRVNPQDITNTEPGEMFVHRNIANLAIDDDLNLQSVIQYAVEVLKVDHVIICGHYNCGGVRAALGPTSLLNVEKWIQPIRDTYQFHKITLDEIPSEIDRVNRLVELNVTKQVENLKKNPMILAEQKARGGYPIVHGWVYELHNGTVGPIRLS